MHSEIKILLEKHLNFDKVRSDYVNYLIETELTVSDEGIDVYDYVKKTSDLVKLCLDDKVTIIRYKFFYEIEMGYDITVKVAIGEFQRDTQAIGLFTVEKCLADIKYNDDLEVYDVEFYKEIG